MKDLSFRGVPSLAIAVNATTPTAPLGSLVWSTTVGKLLVWDGSKWAEVSAAAGGGGWPGPSIAYPKRTTTPKIVGDVAGTLLSTLAMTAARQFFIPLVVPRQAVLSGLRISVTTAVAGTANAGIYSNTVIGGNDSPGNLLAATATAYNTGTTGDKTSDFSSNLTLQPGTLYWASVICSANPTLRALAIGSIQSSLGRPVNNTNIISHLWAAGSGATLSATASTALTEGTSSIPAIYMIEV
jgi:hypothetical protein